MDNTEKINNTDNIIYKWTFSDKKNRWKLWYIIAISVILWLSIWWIFTKQYFLSFIIILIAWVYFFLENNSSDDVEIIINDLGIKINENFNSYSKIESFSFGSIWEELVFLRLILNKKWIKGVDLRINNEIWKELKEILPNFIKETDEWEVSVTDKLINSLKL
jgi:hypothetical protein